MVENGELLELSIGLTEHLQKINQLLENNYHTPDGNHSYSCSLIALEVANLCRDLGFIPRLVRVRNATTLDPMIGKAMSWQDYESKAFTTPVILTAIE